MGSSGVKGRGNRGGGALSVSLLRIKGALDYIRISMCAHGRGVPRRGWCAKGTGQHVWWMQARESWISRRKASDGRYEQKEFRVATADIKRRKKGPVFETSEEARESAIAWSEEGGKAGEEKQETRNDEEKQESGEEEAGMGGEAAEESEQGTDSDLLN